MSNADFESRKKQVHAAVTGPCALLATSSLRPSQGTQLREVFKRSVRAVTEVYQPLFDRQGNPIAPFSPDTRAKMTDAREKVRRKIHSIESKAARCTKISQILKKKQTYPHDILLLRHQLPFLVVNFLQELQRVLETDIDSQQLLRSATIHDAARVALRIVGAEQTVKPPIDLISR